MFVNAAPAVRARDQLPRFTPGDRMLRDIERVIEGR